MNLEYGLPQPFRIYEKVEFQNRFKLGASTKLFRLYCPSNRLLPFQIKTSASEGAITSINLISVDSGASTPVFGLLPNGQLRSYTVGSSKYFVHYGSSNLSATFDQGEYYLEISNGSSTWYSEVMTMKDFSYDITGDSCVLTRIEFWSTCDVDEIFYRGILLGHPQYKNLVYLDVEPGKPNYLYVEEGEEDGNKVFISDLKSLEKEYFLQTPMPEFLTDALSLLPMHVGKKGNIEVLTSRGYLSRVDKVRVEPDWQQEDGAWAMTDLFLITETVLSVNCCPGLEDVTSDGSITADCFDTYTEALATLVGGSLLYNGEHYRPLATGLATPVPEGAVVITSSILPAYNIERLTGGVFVDEAPTAGQVYLDLDVYNSDEALDFPYVFATGVDAEASKYPLLTTHVQNPDGSWTTNGVCYANCVVDVYQRVNGDNVLITTMPSNTFIASGVTYDALPEADKMFIHCRTENGCDMLTSKFKHFEFVINTGIGNMVIGTDFIVAGSMGELP